VVTKQRIHNIIKRIFNPLLIDETKHYLKTWIQGQRERRLFKGVNTYCMFIGSGRTGHTLIASLIDAHPNAIISIELNILKYIQKGYRKNQLFSMILRNSRVHEIEGKTWTGYSYAVKNQMQGTFTTLNVIGDKMGGISTEILMKKPDLLSKIIRKWNISLKFIHVIRNPYDVISSMARGGQLKNLEVNKDLVDKNINRFFKRMDTMSYLYSQFGNLILEIYHERFIIKPIEGLEQILYFLGLSPNKDYLEDCSKIVDSTPSLSRKLVNWSESQIKRVKSESLKYPFLAKYTFEGQ